MSNIKTFVGNIDRKRCLWAALAGLVFGVLWSAAIDRGPYPAEACIARLVMGVLLAVLIYAFIKWAPDHKRAIFKAVLLLLITAVLASAVSVALVRFGVFRSLSKRLLVIVFLSLLLVCAFVMFIRKNISDSLYMALVVFLIGSVFSLSYPVGTGMAWDDQTHYKSIAQISHADAGDLNTADDLLVKSARPDKGDHTLKHIENGTTGQFERKVNKEYAKGIRSTKKPVEVRAAIIPPYMPEAAVLFMGRGIGIKYSHVFILGRWIGVLLYALLLYFTLKQLRSGKLIFFTISMIPTVLFLISSYSYDPWCIAISMFAFAYYLGIMQDGSRKMTTRDIVLICLLFIIAYLPKPNYFCMVLALAFIDNEKLGKGLTKKRYYAILISTCIVLFAVMAVPYLFSGQGGNDMRGGEGVDSAAQIMFILSEPFRYAQILLNFLKVYWSPGASGSYISDLAFLGIVSPYIGFYVFAIVIFILDKQPEDVAVTTAKRRIWTLLLAFAASCLFATIMYIAYTPVKADGINGCQGRYVIPLLMFIGYYISDYRIVAGIRRFITERAMVITASVVTSAYAYYCIYSALLCKF